MWEKGNGVGDARGRGPDWGKWAALTVCVAGVLFALYLLLDVVLSVLLPFLIAFGAAALTRPAALCIAARLRLPVGVLSVILTLFLLFSLGAIGYLFCRIVWIVPTL